MKPLHKYFDGFWQILWKCWNISQLEVSTVLAIYQTIYFINLVFADVFSVPGISFSAAMYIHIEYDISFEWATLENEVS